MKKIIAKRYRIDSAIDEGGFGRVFQGTDLKTKKRVAIKIETKQTPDCSLKKEAQIYEDLQGGEGIPRIKWHGLHHDEYAMVIQFLGPSLANLKNKHEKLSVDFIAKIAKQAIERLRFVHSKGYVVRDIKPSNLLFGLKQDATKIYLIDFGFATKFVDRNHKCVKRKYNAVFVGTKAYASINAHRGRTQYPQDDLESLAYTLIYIATGRLPWANPTFSSPIKSAENVLKLKKFISMDKLCGNLPREFAEFLQSVKDLKYHQTPDYDGYIKMFERLTESQSCLDRVATVLLELP